MDPHSTGSYVLTGIFIFGIILFAIELKRK